MMSVSRLRLLEGFFAEPQSRPADSKQRASERSEAIVMPRCW